MADRPADPASDTTAWADAQPYPVELRKAVRRTRLSMVAERLLAAFWPAWTVAFAGIAVVRLDLLWLVPAPARIAVLAAFALATAAFAARGILRFRWPSEADAVARLDDSLPGRPVAGMRDRLAVGAADTATRGVWALHMRRVTALALRARSARPDLRLSSRDPRALRLGAVALLLAALLFGRGEIAEQIAPAVATPPTTETATGPVLEAWASPPGYTGRPVVYLNEVKDPGRIEVPEGTTLTLRVYGDATPALARDGVVAEGAFASRIAGLHEAEIALAASGTVEVRGSSGPLGAWTFAIIPDEPPAIELAEEPSRTPEGAGQYTYRAKDDYGVTAAWARIALDPARLDRRHGLGPEPEPQPPIEFDLALPLSGGTRDFIEREVVDLATHVWAGLPVTITLHARDAAGQETVAPPRAILLPGRRFFDPLARAVVEQRRDLLWALVNAPRVTRLLKAASFRPEEVFEATKAYLVTRTAIRRLDYALDAGTEGEARPSVAELLWQAALLIEDGDLATALEKLRRAQERLSEALDSDATDEEIAELMQDLREAMQEYLQELMRQALENPGQQQQQQSQNQQQMSTQDLEEMLNRLQQMMQEGRKAEAQELLDQLRQMMENLQMALREGQMQQGPGQQMMQGLQDLMRQQQGLGDQTFGELQRQLGQGQQPGQPRQPGQPGAPGPGTGELSRQQEALRQLLEQFRQGLPPGPPLPGEGDPTGDARRALEEAERQMGEARDALRQGDPGAAVDDQAEALDSLRDGMRALSEAMRQAQNQPGQPDGTMANDRPGEPRDPLGRPLGNNGQIDGSDVRIPGTDAYKRSRELQDEIRRRSGEQDRPKLELDYLRRLLDRF